MAAFESILAQATSLLARVRSQVKEPDMRIVQALGNLGEAQIATGEIQRGLETFRQALDMLKLCQVDQKEAKKMHLALEISLMNDQAVAHGLLNDKAKEQDLMRQALAKVSQSNNLHPDLQVAQLRSIALAHGRADNYELAFAVLQQATELANQSEMPEQKILLLQSSATLNRAAGRLSEAVVTFEALVQAISQVDLDPPTMAVFSDGLNNLVELAVELKKGDLLRQYLEVAAAISLQVTGPMNSRAIFYLELQARVAFEDGQFPVALRFAKHTVRMLDMILPQPDLLSVASLTLLGDIYSSMAKYQKGVNNYRLALTILSTLPSDNAQAKSLAVTVNSALATVLHNIGDQQSSAVCLEQAKKITAQICGNAPSWERIQTLQLTAVAHQDKGDLKAALACYQQALDMSQLVDSVLPRNKSNMLHSIGDVHLRLGNLDLALEHLLSAKELLIEAGAEENHFTASLNLSLANVYDGQQKYSLARDLYLQVVTTLRALFKNPDDPFQPSGHPAVFEALMAYGLASSKLGDYLAANEAFDEALAGHKLNSEGAEGAVWTILMLKIRNNEMLGDIPVWRSCIEQLEELAASMENPLLRKHCTLTAVHARAKFLQCTGQFNAAKELLQQLLKEVDGDEEDIMHSRQMLGEVEFGLGNYKSAVDTLTPLLHQLTAPSEGQVGLKAPNVWVALAGVHVALGDPDKAIGLLLQARDVTLSIVGQPTSPFLFRVEAARADALIKLGRVDEAKDVIEAVQAIVSAMRGNTACFDSEVMLLRGKRCLAVKDFGVALETVKKALAVIPSGYCDHPNQLIHRTLACLGDCYAATGESTLAQSTWNRLQSLLLQECPEHPNLLEITAKLSTALPANATASSSSTEVSANAASSSKV